MTKQDTEIAILKERQEAMTTDIAEIKGDIKEIKAMLTTSFVSRTEFEQNRNDTKEALRLARKSANTKLIITVLTTSIITALVAFFFHEILSGI